MEIHGPHAVGALSRALREHIRAAPGGQTGMGAQGLAITRWPADLIAAIGGEDLLRLHTEAIEKRNRVLDNKEWDSLLDGNND